MAFFDASMFTLAYVIDHLAALTLIGTLLSSAVALLFLHGYLSVFGRELIFALEYTDLPKVTLLGALLLLFIYTLILLVLSVINDVKKMLAYAVMICLVYLLSFIRLALKTKIPRDYYNIRAIVILLFF